MLPFYNTPSTIVNIHSGVWSSQQLGGSLTESNHMNTYSCPLSHSPPPSDFLSHGINPNHVFRLEIFPSVLYTLINGFRFRSYVRAFTVSRLKRKYPETLLLCINLNKEQSLQRIVFTSFGRLLALLTVDDSLVHLLTNDHKTLSLPSYSPLKCP